MEKGILYVTTRPSSPDLEEQYHRWYNDRHLDEVIACEGFRAARRYEPVEISAMPAGVPGAASERDKKEFVAVYDLEAEDLDAAVRTMLERVGDGTIYIDESMQSDPPVGLTLFREIAFTGAD